MGGIIDKIILYLEYLKKDCGLNISVHFDKDTINRIPASVFSKLLPYNSHSNAYCVRAKSICHTRCVNNQKMVLEQLETKDEFCNVCHAQVQEYIYPVRRDSVAIGYVAVSGYRAENPDKKNIFDGDLYDSALKSLLPQKLCDSVIPPLAFMFEQMLKTSRQEGENEYAQLLQFLTEYHTSITLADLAKHFSRSKSHISHLFKKENGLTIPAYCNGLKLDDAKNLLKSTDMSVSEIAYDTGFNDTSYFIGLFKDKFGITPLQYRQKKRGK